MWTVCILIGVIFRFGFCYINGNKISNNSKLCHNQMQNNTIERKEKNRKNKHKKENKQKKCIIFYKQKIVWRLHNVWTPLGVFLRCLARSWKQKGWLGQSQSFAINNSFFDQSLCFWLLSKENFLVQFSVSKTCMKEDYVWIDEKSQMTKDSVIHQTNQETGF